MNVYTNPAISDFTHISADRTLMINTYQLGNDNRQWRIAGDKLQHRLRPNKVLSLREGTSDIEVADRWRIKNGNLNMCKC